LGHDLSHSPGDAPHAATATLDEPPVELSPPGAASRALSLASLAGAWQRTTDFLRQRSAATLASVAGAWQRTANFLRQKGAATSLVSVARSWQRTTDILRQKVVPFVCQPRFWLACITAIGVQVFLAAVMTPAQDDPGDPIRTAANPWPKAAPAPAERIVVPPPQGSHDLIDPPDGGKHGTTTPLGPTAHLDSSSDSAGASGQPLGEADGVNETSAQMRVAENRRLAGDARQFDGGLVGPADGATLEGIVPLESMPESNLHEPQR
jgi:hypothetical protein